MPVDDADDAFDLILVSLDGGRQPLWVMLLEPAELAEVRPLSADLEVLPATCRALFLQCCVMEFGVFVVFLD